MVNKRLYNIRIKEFTKITYECMNPDCHGKKNGNEFTNFRLEGQILPQQCPYCGNRSIKLKSIETTNDKIERIKRKR